MNYEEMSDFEINKLVLGFTNKRLDFLDEKQGIVWISLDASHYDIDEFDPCNNPSDAWPIIVENMIALMVKDYRVDTHEWVVSTHKRHSSGRQAHCDKNPLRAAMICFLKMKDAENA